MMEDFYFFLNQFTTPQQTIMVSWKTLTVHMHCNGKSLNQSDSKWHYKYKLLKQNQIQVIQKFANAKKRTQNNEVET